MNDSLGQKHSPVWRMVASFAFSGTRYLYSKKHGGQAESAYDDYKRYIADGMDESAAAIKAYRQAEGEVVRWPCMPPVYDLEFSPQIGSRYLDHTNPLVLSMIYKLSRDADGIFDIGVPELDEEAREGLRKETGIQFEGIGLQYSEKSWELGTSSADATAESQAEDARVLGYLDEALKTHGPQSVAYVSLGSWAWPQKRPEVVEQLIEGLLNVEPPISFVFAVAGGKDPSAGGLSDEYRKKVEQSGRGILTPWAPQVKVLKHEATSFFLVSSCRQATRSADSA